jgi:PAS domain S-box-containing protein
MPKLCERRFSRFVMGSLIVFEVLTLTLVVGILYGILSSKLEHEHVGQAFLRSNDVAFEYIEHQGHLARDLKRLSENASVRSSIQRGAGEELSVSVAQEEAAVRIKGTKCFVLDPKAGAVFPSLSGKYAELASAMSALSEAAEAKIVYLQNIAGRPCVGLLARPIMTQGNGDKPAARLGTAFLVYDISTDPGLRKRLDRAADNRLLIRIGDGLTDVVTGRHWPHAEPHDHDSVRSEAPEDDHDHIGDNADVELRLEALDGMTLVSLPEVPGVYFGVSSVSLHAERSKLILILSGLCAAVFVLTVILAVIITRRVSGPLAAMVKDAQRIADNPAGSLDEGCLRYGEFQQLADAFNKVLQSFHDTDRALVASEKKFMDVFYESMDPVLLFDGQSFVDCNDATVGLLGRRSKEEIVGKAFWTFSPETQPDGKASSDKARELAVIAKEQGACHFEWLLIGSEGQEITVAVTLTSIILKGRHFFYTVCKDITEREHAREAIQRLNAELEQRVEDRTAELACANEELQHEITERQQAMGDLCIREEQLRLFVENTPASVAMFERNMTYLLASQRWTEFHGLNGESLAGKTHYDVCDSPPEYWKEIYRRSLGGEAAESDEECVDKPDGSQSWVRWKVIPWKKHSGEVGGIIIFTEDITQQKWIERTQWQARKEAEKANRLKSEFLANVSHEIRTPLNAIIGFSEHIRTCDSLSQAHEQSGIILHESEHLLGLINNLLDHAKIEAGKMELEYCPADQFQCLQSVIRSSEAAVEDKGIELHLDIADNVPQYVVCDSLRLRQVLLNLLSNAVKFTAVGGVTVSVECLESANHHAKLRYSVKDTGIGIPLERQKSIFDTFTQADGSITRRYGGTGLGTSIAWRLVEMMKGEMGVESVEGEGSTFWFTVDLDPCQARAEATGLVDEDHSVELPEDCGPARILVAEDYAPNQEVARLHLTGGGHHVEIVEDGQSAIAACMADSYDIILMDIQMPIMDGYEATRAIRASGSDNATIPIIALTANAHDSAREACREAGMDDVLTKPLRKRELLRTIAAWLAKKSAPPRPAAKSSPDTAAPVADALPVDYDDMLEDFGDAALVATVLGTFIEAAEEQLAIIRAAIAGEDYILLRQEAHKIRGGAANLTAMSLADLASRLEAIAENEEIGDAESVYKEFEARFSELRDYAQTLAA